MLIGNDPVDRSFFLFTNEILLFCNPLFLWAGTGAFDDFADVGLKSVAELGRIADRRSSHNKDRR
jgi:hypothetical protein